MTHSDVTDDILNHFDLYESLNHFCGAVMQSISLRVGCSRCTIFSFLFRCDRWGYFERSMKQVPQTSLQHFELFQIQSVSLQFWTQCHLASFFPS